MTLKSRISEDMKAAMRAKDGERLSAIRFLQAAIKQKEIDERIELDDVAIVAVIEKLIKQRRDSITQFEQANRQDLVAKEQAELNLLLAYLPQQLSEAEVFAAIEATLTQVTATGVSGPALMGKAMAVLKATLAGRADMAKVSALLKQKLSA